MAGKQAKILSNDNAEDLLSYASCTRHPARNKVLVLLSTKAGLRAGEIANLTWDMLSGPDGKVSHGIELRDRAAKRGTGRLIPLHPQLRSMSSP
jgi:integrase